MWDEIKYPFPNFNGSVECLSWWRHQIETYSALLAICAGNSPVHGEFPHKGQWRGALMFSLICAWINDWVNNGKAGDLRRHRVHHDVTVMGNYVFPCAGIRGTKMTKVNFLQNSHVTWQWHHNERDGVSNHHPHTCLLNRLFKAQNKENIKVAG